ncbi:MAG: HlyD family secretion protein [Devosia sp.]|jgi:multidrug resistance efflux pump|nr:HlyD family secretion protein [Devosia sp.]
MPVLKLLKSKGTWAALLIGLIGVGVVLYAWQLPPFTSSIQSTNNAFVRGRVTMIAPQLAGYVTQVPVSDYQQVKKGDLLIKLDDRIYQQQLAQAEGALAQQRNALDNYEQNRASKQASLDYANAQLEAAQASLERAEADAARSESLLASGLSPQSSNDQVRAALLQAQSSVAQAQANISVAEQNLSLVEGSVPALQGAVHSAEAAVELARINLANTSVIAPVDGVLGEVTARVGQYVSTGSQLTSVTPPDRWVVANFKETQLASVHVGQEVTFAVDALNHAQMKGHISEISPATGSEFSVIKPDNATGNFTKIAQRIPVRIELDAEPELITQLRPGMSVEVWVDTQL